MPRVIPDLKCNSFNEYPHYVYATAYLLDGKLMDYSIGNRQKSWYDRTFRGFSKWERYVWDNFETLNLYCEYNQILVNNNEEHNKAFDTLEKWVHKTFKKNDLI